jgi:hypothetical protein
MALFVFREGQSMLRAAITLAGAALAAISAPALAQQAQLRPGTAKTLKTAAAGLYRHDRGQAL